MSPQELEEYVKKELESIRELIREVIANHDHSDFGSTRIDGRDLLNAPRNSLTAADGGTINSGHAGTDTIIANIRTRQGEIEDALQALGLLK